MASPAAPSPDSITLDKFNAALEAYPILIEATTFQGPNPDKPGLGELDAFRYDEAPALFSDDPGRVSRDKPKRAMVHDDVKRLVEWKLRHGTFRPSLMKLVSGNDPTFVKDTIHSAKQAYTKDSDNPKAALDILCKLKGIGPATASLLLSVHDPKRVIFFSDEAFYWLCGGGKKVSIKYNAKEYAALGQAAAALRARLKVSATDIEKVSYVLMKLNPEMIPDKPEDPGQFQPPITSFLEDKQEGPRAEGAHVPKKQGNAGMSASSKKRKPETPVPEDSGKSGVRRSKRVNG